MYKYQVALPPFPRFSSQTPPSRRKQGAPPTRQDPQCIPAPCSARGAARGQEDISPLLPCSFSGCGCGGPRLCSWGARAPSPGSFLLWFHPEIVLDGFIPLPKLQAPTGGLKALTGVLGRPPGQPPSPVLWAGPPPGTFPPASAQARDRGGSVLCTENSLSDLSQLCRRS